MQTEPVTTIEEKRYSPEATDEALTRALRGKKGRLTKADAIALSGLPTHLVDDSLDRLLKRYRSRLEVTEDGELLYSFDPSLQRRDQMTFAERARAVGRGLARGGMWAFKGWITLTFVVYVVGFLLLVLGMMFGGDDRRRDDRRGNDSLGWLWWFLLPDWRGSGYGYGYGRDPWGRQLPQAPPRGQLGDGRPKKKFIQSVFDFVFGPAQPKPDQLTDEREILAYVRGHDGRITATDLVGMFGWSYHKAEEEVTRLLVDYDGEPEVTDEGVIIYEFPKLLKSAGAETAIVPRMSWEKQEKRPVLTGNSTGMDWFVGAFAAFNLLASFFAAGWARMRYGLGGPTWSFILTTFPLMFFGLFLGIPAVRAAARSLGDRARARRNERKQLIKEVWETGGPLPMKPGLEDFTLALEGEPEVDAGGAAVIKFPRVAEEREALAKHLQGVDLGAEKRIGKVIFGGDDDEVEQEVPKIAEEKTRPRLKS